VTRGQSNLLVVGLGALAREPEAFGVLDAMRREGAFVGLRREYRRLSGLRRCAAWCTSVGQTATAILEALRREALSLLQQENQRREGGVILHAGEYLLRLLRCAGSALSRRAAPRLASRRVARTRAPRPRSTRRRARVAVAAAPGGEDGSSDAPPPHAPGWGLPSRSPRLIFPSHTATHGAVPGGSRYCCPMPKRRR